MKKLTLISIIALFLFSCSSDTEDKGSKTSSEEKVTKTSTDDGKLPALEIEVPSELEGNKEAEEIIKTGEEVINKFSNTIEEVLQENKELIGKDPDDYTLGETMQAGKIALQITAGLAEFAPKFANLENQLEELQKGELSDEQKEALKKIGDAFQKRMDEIEQKYKGLVE